MALVDYLDKLTTPIKPPLLTNEDFKAGDVAFGENKDGILWMSFTRNNVLVVVHAPTEKASDIAHEIYMAILSDSIDGQKAVENRGKISFSPVCILDDNKSISGAINEWLKKWDRLEKLKYISIVGSSGNKSMHYYYYYNEGIDTDKIYKIMKGN